VKSRKSMFYTDDQGCVRYIGGKDKKAQGTAQIRDVQIAPTRQKAGFFFKDELGRTRFAGGPGGGGGISGQAQAMSSDDAVTLFNDLGERFGIPVNGVIESDNYNSVSRIGLGNKVEVNFDLLNSSSSYMDYDRSALPKTPKDVLVHEYGHLIHSELAFNPSYAKYKLSGSSELRNMAGVTWEESLTRRLEGIAKTHGSLLSDYASKNAEEYFAEAFLAYTRGGNTRDKIHPEVLAIFKDLDRQS
jgi:hypothetical protein